ncbi:MAG: YciI family protein [Gammaproteobacteria bacterium]
MKFLCLAFGDEDGWNSLSENEKQEVLAQDEVIRNRGNLMTAIKQEVTTVKNWDKNLEVENSATARGGLPLAGFSVIEANNVEEVITMVSNTPCARAKGYIEIRPFWDFGDENA